MVVKLKISINQTAQNKKRPTIRKKDVKDNLNRPTIRKSGGTSVRVFFHRTIKLNTPSMG